MRKQRETGVLPDPRPFTYWRWIRRTGSLLLLCSVSFPGATFRPGEAMATPPSAEHVRRGVGVAWPGGTGVRPARPRPHSTESLRSLLRASSGLVCHRWVGFVGSDLEDRTASMGGYGATSLLGPCLCVCSSFLSSFLSFSLFLE